MTQPLTAPMMSTTRAWYTVWWQAITQPTVVAYEALANDAGATAQRAYRWIFLSSLVVALIAAFTQPGQTVAQPEEAFRAARGSVATVCLVPSTAAAGVLGFALVTWITQQIAKMLGGSGTYSKLAFATAAYTAPLSVVGLVLGQVPYLWCLLLPLIWGYTCVLNVVAIRAVNQLTWGRAMIPTAVIAAATVMLVALVVVFAIITALPTAGG
jgi:hypothetical protein